jgi:pilus assembly protein CpaB
MKPKTLVLMFVAIGCGLAASYMTSRVIAERTSEQAEVEKVSVLVAKKNIPLGTLVKNPETMFEDKFFVKGEEPKKALRTFDQLKDKRLNKPVTAEQFVTDEDLIDKSSGSLEAVVQPGMRAIGLKVNVESSGGGFVMPHSRVDLVHVVKTEKETTSKIIMQNVLVLGVDQAVTKPEDKNSFVPQTVTVEVTPSQAEALSLAQDIGSIKLILRGFGDDEKVATTGSSPKTIGRNGEGKPEDTEEAAPAKETSPKYAHRIPDVGGEDASIPEVKAPVTKKHLLTIQVGDQMTRHSYAMNANNEVISEDSQGRPEEGSSAAIVPTVKKDVTKPEAPQPEVTKPETVKPEAPKSEAPAARKSYKPTVSPTTAKTDPKKSPAETTKSPTAGTGFQEAPLPKLPGSKSN